MPKKLLCVFLAIFSLFSIHRTTNVPTFSNYANTFEISLDNGSFSNGILTVNKSDFALYRGIKGESCEVKKENFDINAFLTDFEAEMVACEKVGDIVCYYAFSPKVKYLEKVNGKKVNLHVAVRDNAVVIGTPIIYGSF